MPQVLIPIAITAAAGAAAVALGAATFTAVAISVAATAVAAGASYLLAPTVVPPALARTGRTPTNPIAAPANAERTFPVAQSVPPRRFVYGPCRTAGALFFQDNANPYLLIGSALSDGTIEAVDAVYFGEESIPCDANGDALSTSRFSGKFKFEWTQGLSSQAASALITANFPSVTDSNFRQQGVARGVVRLDWGTDAAQHQALWGDSIAPSFQGRFLRVYDPRDATQSLSDAATWKYSANPALCVAHALVNAWGVGVAASYIDFTSVATAANICDEMITFGDTTFPIFRCAGVFQADVEFGSQLADMLTSFRGKIVFGDGKYSIVADTARASVWTITDDDILEIGEYSHATEARALFNAISASYFNASDGGLRTTTTPYELSAAVAAEGLRETSVTLPFTPDDYSAQILAYRELQATRDGRALAVRLIDAATYLSPSDVVTITTTGAVFLNGTYEVVQVDLADNGVLVVLRGYTSAVYTDSTTYLV